MAQTGAERVGVFLEINPSGPCLCHCLAYPGATLKAPTAEMALRLAPSVIAEERCWYARHGLVDAADAARPLEVFEAERVVLPVAVQEGDTEALFGPHREPLTETELAFGLRVLEASRRALLDLTGDMGQEWLDFRPGPSVRTIGEILGHLADADAFYRARLEATGADTGRLWDEAAARGEPPLYRLEHARRALVQRLRSATPGERARVARHDPHGEEWTARKVLYRAIWHERYHTRQIVRYLTA